MTRQFKKEVHKTYIVCDYGGIIDEFNRLPDARKCLKEAVLPGQQGRIISKTVEVITLETIKVIQGG